MKYLGDGDSRGYKKVCDENVYGSDCSIEKLECIAHVQKRMGPRLKKIRSEMKGEKLAKGMEKEWKRMAKEFQVVVV